MSADAMLPPDDLCAPDHDEHDTARGFNRRRFLVGSGLAGAAVVVASRAGGSGGKVGTTATGAMAALPEDRPVLGQSASGDLATAQFAAGLEALAVGTYQAAVDAATTNKLGAVPPAGAEFVKTALAQHQAHQDAWNKIVTGAGKPAVTAPDPGLKPTVDAEFAKVTDFAGAARLALLLEEIAAATYLSALRAISNRDAVKLAASIQAVDAKHAAILHYVLGEYPVPDVFAQTAKAAKPTPAAAGSLPKTH